MGKLAKVHGLGAPLGACRLHRELVHIDSTAPPLGAGTTARLTGVIPPVDVSGQLGTHVHNLGARGRHPASRHARRPLPARTGAAATPPQPTTFRRDGISESGRTVVGVRASDVGCRSPCGSRIALVTRRPGLDRRKSCGLTGLPSLTVSASTVLGLSTHRGGLLMRSAGLGHTWEELGVPGVFDVALDPTDLIGVVRLSLARVGGPGAEASPT